MIRRRSYRLLALVAAVGLAVTACSSSDDDSADASTTTADSASPGDDEGTDTDVAPREIPDGPAASLSDLDGGKGPMLVTASALDLEGAGYVESEHAAAGTATSFVAADGDLPTDGRFVLEPDAEADYATRILVRRPADAADASGTVVVEWLNVSSGSDAAPDFTYASEEILRAGHVWVGVSAQHIGIEGGPVAVDTPVSDVAGAGQGLKAIDPERYGDLAHPGDAFSYDIFTQIGRALRATDSPALDGIEADQVLAIGESQSGFALTTYANGIQPLAGVYDGILIHSRGGAAAPLGAPDAGIDIAGTIGGEPTIVRDDLDIPVLIIQTEGDVIGLLNYLPARQPDTDLIRVWEVAGSAHADSFQVGPAEGVLGCGAINSGQQVFVIRAGLRHLATWADGGDPAPSAEPLVVEGEGPEAAFVRDEQGNATGGVRTPVVDAPLDTLSGVAAPGASVICLLMGSTTPLAADVIAGLYASGDEYSAAYEAATDSAIEAGFVLADDRNEVLTWAEPDRVG